MMNQDGKVQNEKMLRCIRFKVYFHEWATWNSFWCEIRVRYVWCTYELRLLSGAVDAGNIRLAGLLDFSTTKFDTPALLCNTHKARNDLKESITQGYQLRQGLGVTLRNQLHKDSNYTRIAITQG